MIGLFFALLTLVVKYTIASTSYIMHFTDIHVDVDYREGADVEQMCIQGTGDAAPWGEIYKCNGNYNMLDGLLNEAIAAFGGSEKIKMAAFTGDLEPDYLDPVAFREHYDERVLEDARIANNYLNNIFKQNGNIPLVYARGNHDNAFVSNYAWYDKKYTNFVSKLWDEGSVGNSMKAAILKSKKTNKLTASDISYVSSGLSIEESWKNTSYYVTALPFNTKRDVWVISLDSNLCDIENVFYDLTRETDPLNMWKWLEDVFAKIEEVNNKYGLKRNIIILSHHPFNMSDGTSPRICTTRLNELFKKYESHVLIHLVGHTHSNELSIRTGTNIFTLNSGSTQSFTVGNGTYPTLSFVEIDDDTLEIIDIHRFYYNILEAKTLTRDEIPNMKKFSIKEFYGLNKLDPNLLRKEYQKAVTNEKFFEEKIWWLRSLGMRGIDKCTEKTRKSTVCSLMHSDPEDYENCKKSFKY